MVAIAAIVAVVVGVLLQLFQEAELTFATAAPLHGRGVVDLSRDWRGLLNESVADARRLLGSVAAFHGSRKHFPVCQGQ